MKNTAMRENKNFKYKALILSIFGVLLLCSLAAASAANQTVDQSAIATGNIQNNISAAIENTVAGDTITINPGTYSGSGNNTNLNINHTLTIEGNGTPGSVVIDGGNLTQIFQIANDTNVTFINITFINGNNGENGGGAIENQWTTSTLNFINCTFINNYANDGGAIYTEGNISISNCNFSNNTAMYYNSSGPIMGGYGGAIYNTGNMNVSNSTFTGNNATVNGGAITSINGILDVNGSNFTNNVVGPTVGNDYGGGAIYIGSSENPSGGAASTIDNSNFIGNNVTQSVNGSGGAISIVNPLGNTVINNSNFTNNYVDPNSNFGGTIYTQSNLTVEGSNFNNNSAGAGGGIYNNVGGDTTIVNSTFNNNTVAGVGGGVYNENGAFMNISTSNFTDNSASYGGGGIFNNGNMSLTGNNMSGNTAGSEGNVILNIGEDGAVIANLNLTYLNNQTVNVIHGENITLTANLTDDMGNPVTDDSANLNFYVNGTLVGTAQPIEGVASVTYIVTSAPGDMTFTVNGTYGGSQNPITILQGTLEVNVIANSTINIPSNVTINQTINITGVVADSHGIPITNVGSINVTIGNSTNNQTFNVTVDSTTGAWSLEYTSTVAGTFNVTAYWPGNADWDAFTNSSTLIVNRLSSVLTISVPSPITVGQTTTITGTLKDSSGNPISGANLTLSIGNQTFTVTTDSNGDWSQSYTPNSGGNLSAQISWEGSEAFASLSNGNNFVVNKIATIITISSPNNATVGQTITLTSTLTDENGNPISGAVVYFYIDNSFLSSGAGVKSASSLTRNTLTNTNSVNIGSGVTNSNGIATMQYTFNNAGTAVFTAAYNENGTYYSSNATNQTTVSPTSGSRVKSVLTLKTDKNGITATLTDINGNPLEDREITITINGKTFTETTNSNGQVIINYPNANSYTVVGVFAGDDEYYPSNVTVSPHSSSNASGKVAMKKTSIPIVMVLLVLLSSLVLFVRKK